MQGTGETGIVMHCWEEYEMAQPLWKSRQFLRLKLHVIQQSDSYMYKYVQRKWKRVHKLYTDNYSSIDVKSLTTRNSTAQLININPICICICMMECYFAMERMSDDTYYHVDEPSHSVLSEVWYKRLCTVGLIVYIFSL